MEPKSYIIRNEFGAFCSACQSPLGIEEDDFDTCDACGGDGIGDSEADEVFQQDDEH